ncbi:MAG: LptF/LptG family permease, partial [Gemmatimonadaceae bacterium]|nr:LptF/LptG family permease [Gemmatimonadaceae bacterium]
TPPQRMLDSKRPLRMMPLALLGVVVSVIAYGLNTQVLPKANTELQWLQNGKRDGFRGDRSLAPHELQSRWRELEVQLAADRTQIAKRSTLETINSAKVEYHKKYAISAACLFLTLFAVALTRRMRRISLAWQVPISVAVFTGYYVLLIAGESLGDSGTLAPSLAMWSANFTLVLLTMALGLCARRRAASWRGQWRGSET